MMDWKIWIPLIGVLIAGTSALRQIRSNNITNAKLKWLENFKIIVSDFLSESSTLVWRSNMCNDIFERIKTQPNKEAELYANKLQEALVENIKVVDLKYYLVKLALDPKEKIHIKFEQMLNQYMDVLNKVPLSDSAERKKITKRLREYSENFILINRYITKLDWEKTKRNDLSFLYYIKIGKGKKILKEALLINKDL
jgi:hypothetical protein